MTHCGPRPRRYPSGPAALEVVLLPCLERAADCPEEPVVAAAADCLAQMADDRQLRKPALLRAASHLLPRVLLHPSPAVRSSAVKLAAAMARALPPVDRYARLLPMLLPALGSEPTGDLADEAVLAACLLRPTGGAGCQDPQRSGTDGGGGSGDAPGDAASGGASWPPPPGGESDDGPPEWAEQVRRAEGCWGTVCCCPCF